MTAIVTGHKNPDTDSIASAIALADLMSKRGIASRPFAQGIPTPESKFLLKRFGLPEPEVISSVAGKKFFLVDHSDRGQAPEGLDEAELLGIVDHHKLGDITTSMPLLMWVWPVGCSCTVIKNMYDFYGVEIPANVAGMMLGAILSDTVIFKSPTTTDDDRKAVEDLVKLAGIDDFKEFGMEIFRVKSAVDGVPAKDLLFRDYKDFEMNGKKVGVGQLEVIDLGMLENVKQDLAAAVDIAKKDGRHTVFLLLTDIMKEGSALLWASDDNQIIKKTFGVDGKTEVWLPRVMSRKKDVIPQLEAAMK